MANLLFLQQNQKATDLYNQITDNIYISSFEVALSEAFLTSKNINVIVNCTNNERFPNIKRIKKYRLPLEDMESDKPLFEKYIPIGAELIGKHIKKNRNILVHCTSGFNRSAAVIAGYLILYQNMSAQEAIKYIRDKRSYAIRSNFIPEVLEKIYQNKLK